MAEQKRTLEFVFADTGGVTPWGVSNSNPSFPVGYILGGGQPRIQGNRFRNITNQPVNTAIIDTTPLTGEIVAAEGYFGHVGSAETGFLLTDENGNGYMVLANSSNVRVRAISEWIQGSQIGATISFVVAPNYYGRFERNNTTGVMTFYSGEYPESIVARGFGTQASANTEWRAGVVVRDNGEMASLVSAYSAAQTVNSFNGTNSIAVGQAVIPFETTGFTGGQITAITSAESGVSTENIVLSGLGDGSGVVDIAGFVEGAKCPQLPTTIGWTFSDGSNSASITKNLTIPAGYSQVEYIDAYAPNDRVFAWHLVEAGISIANGTRVIWPTTEGFSFNSDGDTTSNALRTINNVWVRDVSDGKMYEFSVTIDDAGDVVDDTPDPFTFTAVTDATLNTTYTSNEVTITGLGVDVEADLTIIDGLYSKNGGAYISTAGVISNGDTLRVRRNSSGSYATAVDLDVTVGTYTTQFSITTKADNDPDTIKFATLSALSDIKTITGLAGSTPITIVGGEYSKNGGGFTASAGTVVNTDTIQLSSEDGVTVRVTIGGKTFSWNSKGGSGGGFGGSIGIGI